MLLTGCGPGTAHPPSAAPEAPARRIITLAPHLAELVYAAGAGDRMVGVVEYSNYPAEARQLPRVGDAFRVDFEAVAALRPDLILAWPSGNSTATVQRLERLGFRVVGLEPATLDDVGLHLATIGRLAGTSAVADQAAAAWAKGLEELRQRHRGAAPVTVFYQIAPRPLVTVTGRHFIGQAIALCGGENIFAEVPGLAPVVGVEAVVAAGPEAIVANALESGPADSAVGSPLVGWRQWPALPAVATGDLYEIDPSLMSVPGPRMLGGIRELCADLDLARRKRTAAGFSP
jgi:iron complex transport system substrate-binding protein